jgi:hypothetical protein
MGVELATFVQRGLDGAELAVVADIATTLQDHLNTPQAQMQLLEANQPGGSSALVQAVFIRRALELGFASEKKGLFLNYGAALRPDYYRPLPEFGTGIILEVERGKTTTNNMDLLDMWKCHLCETAHHLFLLVPLELRHNELMSPKREFATVSRRLGTFFDPPENYVNVRTCSIFGY